MTDYCKAARSMLDLSMLACSSVRAGAVIEGRL